MYFELDPAALEAIKAESKDEDVPFLSSNDVVTATFLSASGADLGLMADLWRGKKRISHRCVRASPVRPSAVQKEKSWQPQVLGVLSALLREKFRFSCVATSLVENQCIC